MSTYLLQTDIQRSTLGGMGFPERAYGTYGAILNLLGPLQGFAGQMRDSHTGWYHLGNGRRVYNPVLMRFHSADRLSPFGKGGLNAYAYCLGDPVNYQDPSGQVAEFVGPVLGILGNGIGLLSSGLKGRAIFKINKTFRAEPGLGGTRRGVVASSTIDAMPNRVSRRELGLTVLSGVSGAVGLVTSVLRFFDKDDDVMYIGFVASAISLLTTGYEVYTLAVAKPWNRYPIDPRNILMNPLPQTPLSSRSTSPSRFSSAIASSIRQGSRETGV